MRALLLLYYWPPSGGPGVQRGVKLCRHLRAAGVEPSVVTVDPATYALPGEYAPDPTLAADVPPGLRVVRTAANPRARERALLVRSRLFRPVSGLLPQRWFERQAGWLRPAADALLREIADARPDVLFTSSQPYTAHLAGRAAKLASGVPWVADFRDPWTFAWGRTWPSRRALAWEERREEEVLADADVVVANTPGTRDEWVRRRPWLDPRKIVVVRNGYDPDDFTAGPAPRAGSDFLVVHAGAFRARPPGREREGLRRFLDRGAPEPVPYDLGTHSPEPLLRAVAALPAEARARVTVRLVGSVEDGWLRLARDLGVADRVEAPGYVAHRESVASLLAADLLWLPTITRRDGGPVANVPAKTYEYLGSGRPVLSLAGPGDVRDLLAGRERCRVVAPGPDAVAEITDLLARRIAGEPGHGLPPDPPDAHAFRRDETARSVAEALRIAAGGPSRLDPAAPAVETPSVTAPVTARDDAGDQPA